MASKSEAARNAYRDAKANKARPRKIRYNNHPLRIKWGDPGQNNYAYHIGRLRTILVHRDLKPRCSLECLLHEIVHAMIYEHHNMELEFNGKTQRQRDASQEKVVDTLARDLTMILLHNPQLLDFIVQTAGTDWQ
jgi:hypothetical protein